MGNVVPVGEDIGGGPVADDNQHSPERPAVPDVINVQPIQFYYDEQSIFDQLEPLASGKPRPVKLLDSDWLMLRADAIAAASGESERQALAVPRRQKLEELHADAYMSIDAIKALPCCAIGEGSEMAIGSVSHAWLAAHHPDLLGEQLERLVATMRKAQSEAVRANDFRYKLLPKHMALFYDWASLFQMEKGADGRILQKRSRDEDEAFVHALKTMMIWYVHRKLIAFLITKFLVRCADSKR